jgi:outer membrane protein assembly factor BamB
MSIRDELRSKLISDALILGEYTVNKTNRIIFDTREALLEGKYLRLAGELMWDKIKFHNPTVIYGNGLASFPLLSSIQIAASNDGKSIKTLLVRDKRKYRNRHRLIEGPRPKIDERAVFIDDLMNTGTTYKKCQDALIEEGIRLQTVACCVLIDFYRFRGSRRLRTLGMPVECVFDRRELGDTRADDTNPKVNNKVLWRNLASNQWPQFKGKTIPKIVDNRVYYGNDHHEIYCHDTETGDILWKFQGPKPYIQKGLGVEIVIDGDYLIVTSYDGAIYKMNRHTGQLVWKRHLDMYLHSAPHVDCDRLFVATEGGISLARGDIVCLDNRTGNTIWRYETKGGVIPCSPNLLHGMVICGSNNGNLYSLNPLTGQLNWIVEGIGEAKGRANTIDDVIVVTTEDGKIYGISLTGDIIWMKPCGTYSIHQFLQVHTVHKLVYVINSDGMLAAFNKYGNKIWIRRLRADGAWNLTLKGNELISITTEGHIDVVDPETGHKIRSERLGYEVRCPCDFNDKYIAVNSISNGFYFYERLK